MAVFLQERVEVGVALSLREFELNLVTRCLHSCDEMNSSKPSSNASIDSSLFSEEERLESTPARCCGGVESCS